MSKGQYWSWSTSPASLGTIYPQSRQGHTLCYSSSLHSLIMFGGRSTNPTNDIFVYNISSSSWSRIKCSGNAPSTVSYHNSLILRNPINSQEVMIVIGGLKDTDISTNEILVLSLVKWKWKPLKFYERFLPRHHATICVVEGRLCVFGGTQKPELKLLNDLWSVDVRGLLEGNEEVKLRQWGSRGCVPERRYGHISFTDGKGLMVAWGCLDSQKQDRSIYSYCFSKQQWSSFSPNGLDIQPRSYSSCLQISPHETIIFGGQTISHQLFLPESYIYNTLSNLWISPFLTSSKPIPRKHQAACILPDAQTIYMLGGLNKKFCSMEISSLTLKQHDNDLKWVKIKEETATGKAAKRILGKSIENNYQEIALLEKFLKEENHELKALKLMEEALESKWRAEVRVVEEQRKEEEKVREKVQRREEMEGERNGKKERLIGREKELRGIVEERILSQEVYLLNILRDIQVLRKSQGIKGEGIISKIEENMRRVDQLVQMFDRIDKYT